MIDSLHGIADCRMPYSPCKMQDCVETVASESDRSGDDLPRIALSLCVLKQLFVPSLYEAHLYDLTGAMQTFLLSTNIKVFVP